MKEFLLISILTLMVSLGGFAQTEKVDSKVYDSRCECIEDVYRIKKEFLENVSSSDGTIKLNPAFFENNQINWKAFTSIDSRCKDMKQNAEDPPCPHEEDLKIMADEIQLIIRVVEMTAPSGCNDITPKTN